MGRCFEPALTGGPRGGVNSATLIAPPVKAVRATSTLTPLAIAVHTWPQLAYGLCTSTPRLQLLPAPLLHHPW